MAFLHYVGHKKRDFFQQSVHKLDHMWLLPVIENTSTGSQGTVTYSITHYIILYYIIL